MIIKTGRTAKIILSTCLVARSFVKTRQQIIPHRLTKLNGSQFVYVLVSFQKQTKEREIVRRCKVRYTLFIIIRDRRSTISVNPITFEASSIFTDVILFIIIFFHRHRFLFRMCINISVKSSGYLFSRPRRSK